MAATLRLGKLMARFYKKPLDAILDDIRKYRLKAAFKGVDWEHEIAYDIRLFQLALRRALKQRKDYSTW